MEFKLKEVVDSYMQKLSGLKEHCERWNSNAVLMIIPALSKSYT
jgi:hypothetical protein